MMLQIGASRSQKETPADDDGGDGDGDVEDSTANDDSASKGFIEEEVDEEDFRSAMQAYSYYYDGADNEDSESEDIDSQEDDTAAKDDAEGEEKEGEEEEEEKEEEDEDGEVLVGERKKAKKEHNAITKRKGEDSYYYQYGAGEMEMEDPDLIVPFRAEDDDEDINRIRATEERDEKTQRAQDENQDLVMEGKPPGPPPRTLKSPHDSDDKKTEEVLVKGKFKGKKAAHEEEQNRMYYYYGEAA